MTLGRVYVPPSRATNQFMATSVQPSKGYGGSSFNSNNNNNNDNSNLYKNSNSNVIVNGFGDSKKQTAGYRTIQIKVEKKEEKFSREKEKKGKSDILMFFRKKN